MKKIIYTQRVEVIESYGERRDSVDQNIARFLNECGFLPVPIMNIPALAGPFCEEIRPDGIFLTGGNDLASYGGNAPERDETEKILLEYAMDKDIPILGICRGMQFIADYFGSELIKVNNHVRTRHMIRGEINRKEVNSFHNMGIMAVKDPLILLSRSDDGVAEVISHKEKKIAAIMWHPEREKGFSNEDINMIKTFYEKGRFV